MDKISRLQDVPVIVITTPSKFSNPCLNDGHRSLWTIQHFETRGFKTQFYRRNMPMELIYGEGIVALKGPESLQQRMIQAVLEHNRTEPIRIEGTDAHAMTDLMVLLMIMGCSSEFLDDVLERLWNAQVRSTNKQPDFFDVFRQYPTGKLLIRDHGREFK